MVQCKVGPVYSHALHIFIRKKRSFGPSEGHAQDQICRAFMHMNRGLRAIGLVTLIVMCTARAWPESPGFGLASGGFGFSKLQAGPRSTALAELWQSSERKHEDRKKTILIT